jgi:hypothetical protein
MIGAVLFLMAGSAGATTLCSSTTLTTLLGTGYTCEIQSLIFSNFSYSPTGTDVAAANITANMVTNTVTQEAGWAFSPTVGAWTSGFNFSFTVSVDPLAPLVAIVASKDQMNSGAVIPPNGVTAVDTQTAGTMTMQGTSTGETQFIGPFLLGTLNTASVGTIPGGKSITSYEQDFFEGSAAPEPATFGLIGGALLGLGLLGRKRFLSR